MEYRQNEAIWPFYVSSRYTRQIIFQRNVLIQKENSNRRIYLPTASCFLLVLATECELSSDICDIAHAFQGEKSKVYESLMIVIIS